MKKILILSAVVASVIGVQAEDAPCFQASLTPDIAIYSKTTQINGLTLSIWGENPQTSVALGLVNGSTGVSKGFSWGIFNYSEDYTGVQWAPLNVNKTRFVGWQSGWVNIAQGEFTGFQSAYILNYAKDFTGLQLGIVNYAQNLRGVQIGFANIAMNNPWFKEFPDKLATGFPIVNWSF